MNKIGQIITIANMVVMVLLIVMITLQSRSSGLSTVFGGAGSIVQTRRGFEKWLFYTTIVCGVLFVGLSITALIINK